MSEATIEIEHHGSVAWIWMNRPTVHNALNETMIEELTQAFATLGQNDAVRAIVLSGRGKSFSAGADLDWMKRQGAAPREENIADAQRLAAMFQAIATCARPTIARVQGAAIGGGMGFVCACDIAIATKGASFATSEVRLGLIPATIGPYVVRTVGQRWTRRLFQTGERITAEQAERIALVHEAVDPEALDDRVQAVAASLLLGAPRAQRAAKELVDAVAGHEITTGLMEDLAESLAAVRAGAEAGEGLQAFLEKRPAAWVREN